MNDLRTNLLPAERQRALLQDYFIRLSVVVLLVVTALVVVGGLLLIPTHVFLTQSAATKQAHLASIESILTSSNEVEVSTRLAALSHDAEVLSALGTTPSASVTLRKALSIPHPGVMLTGFSYTPAEKSTSGTLEISGTAATREVLRTYQLAIQSDAAVASANLPVSAYAKDTNIAFTITITLAP